MPHYENTTRITQEGYRTILYMKRQKQRIICRAIGVLLAVPFLERAIYYLILHFTTKQKTILGIPDLLFTILLLAAIWFWTYPSRNLNQTVERTKKNIDLQAVHQYIFLPDGITMMTTSSLEKFHLSYSDLTWVRSNKNWMVLWFENQNFTMLVDKKGFHKGTAAACQTFLRDRLDGKEMERQHP